MRIQNQIVAFITVVIIALGACKSTDISYNVISLKKAKGVRNNAIMYFLPKTVIQTQVKLKRTINKKGEYSNYAKKYLDINNVITQNNEKWEIVEADFLTFPIIDSSKLFLIEHNDEAQDISIHLSKCGMLKSINSKNELFVGYVINDKINIIEKAFTKTTNKTLVKTKSIGFDEVALPKQVVNSRTISEKARILADKILTLREDRAATIVGDGYTKDMPDGASLAIMIENINKLEKQYLSLFKGKTITETYTYTFNFIPKEARNTTQKILFRFSQKKGIVEINDMDGKPVIIELNAVGNLKQVIGFNKSQEHLKRIAKIQNSKKGLHYIVPDIANVSLLLNDDKLAEKNILLSQFGVVQNLPAKYLNGKYAIDMNSELGSINKISKITK